MYDSLAVPVPGSLGLSPAAIPLKFTLKLYAAVENRKKITVRFIRTRLSMSSYVEPYMYISFNFETRKCC